jgi:hypothetical protein
MAIIVPNYEQAYVKKTVILKALNPQIITIFVILKPGMSGLLVSV